MGGTGSGRPRAREPGTDAAALIVKVLIREGVTNAELAKAIGMNASKLSQLLSDTEPNPTLRTIEGLAKATGISAGKLADGFLSNRNSGL